MKEWVMSEVSEEWAKQLALEAYGPLEFGTMRVEHIPPGVHYWRVVAYPNPMTGLFGQVDYSMLVDDPVHTIYPEPFYDAVNGEITRLGYCPQANVLVVGETVSVPSRVQLMVPVTNTWLVQVWNEFVAAVMAFAKVMRKM